MAKKKLVISTISGNEAKWVKQFVESTIDVVDHYVINLTQYDDNTEELLRKYIPKEKLTLVKYPWEKNFSKARNQALKHTPDWADYIFYIDMDEKLTKDSIGPLNNFLEQEEVVVGLVTIYNSLEQKSLLASLYYPRIFPWKDSKGRFLNPYFDGEVHNQLMGLNSIPAVRLPVYLMHYGYGLSKEEMEKKHKRSEELLREQIRKNNDSFFAHLNLAQLLRAKGDFVGTEKHAREVLRIVEESVNKGNKKYAHAYLMSKDQLATALLAQKKVGEALIHLNDALKVKPDHLDSILNMGHAYFEMGDFDKAEFWFKRYLFIRSRYDENRDNTNLILNHLNSSLIAYYNLGVLNAIKNKFNEALQYFERGFKLDPSFRDIFIKYINTLRILGRMDEFQYKINDFLHNYPEKSGMVYYYLGHLALQNCDIELAKFNFYQGANLEKDEENNKAKEAYEFLSRAFGPVSNRYFDTSDVERRTLEKVQ